MEQARTKTGVGSGHSIHPDTRMGPVRLGTSDIERSSTFYERAIGLRRLDSSDSVVSLGVDASPLVELIHHPGASPRPYGTTGLFHLAILVPDRLELARSVRRVVDADWSFTGASDHLVSEAMYLDDPEGNGIEIYRDRPRSEWRFTDGVLEMATLPLDIDDLIGELSVDPEPSSTMAPGTRMGHVHLQVSDLSDTEDFYAGLLGFDVTVRGYPGALFVSAGGYHHHLGLNTWASRGGRQPPPGSRGLNRFEITVPSEEELTRIGGRLGAGGVPTEHTNEGFTTTDPSGNRLHITV